MVIITSSCPSVLAKGTWSPAQLENVHVLAGTAQQFQVLQATCKGNEQRQDVNLLVQSASTAALSDWQREQLQHAIQSLCSRPASNNLVQVYAANTEVLKEAAIGLTVSNNSSSSVLTCGTAAQQQQQIPAQAITSAITCSSPQSYLQQVNKQPHVSNSKPAAAAHPEPFNKRLLFITHMPGQPLLQHLAAAAAPPAAATTAAAGDQLPSPGPQIQLTERQAVATVLKQLLESLADLSSQGINLPCLLPLQLWVPESSPAPGPAPGPVHNGFKTHVGSAATPVVASSTGTGWSAPSPPGANSAGSSWGGQRSSSLQLQLQLLPLLLPLVQPLAAAAAVSEERELQYLSPELLLQLVSADQQQPAAAPAAPARPKQVYVSGMPASTCGCGVLGVFGKAADCLDENMLGGPGGCGWDTEAGNGNEANTKYYSKALSWSVGVLTYQLLTGQLPLKGTTAAQLAAAVAPGTRPGRAGQLLKLPLWMSDGAKDFIAAATHRNPSARASPCELLHHPWIISMAFTPTPPADRCVQDAPAAAAGSPLTREEVVALQGMQGGTISSPKVVTAADAAVGIGGSEERWRPRVWEVVLQPQQPAAKAATGAAGAAGGLEGNKQQLTAPQQHRLSKTASSASSSSSLRLSGQGALNRLTSQKPTAATGTAAAPVAAAAAAVAREQPAAAKGDGSGTGSTASAVQAFPLSAANKQAGTPPKKGVSSASAGSAGTGSADGTSSKQQQKQAKGGARQAGGSVSEQRWATAIKSHLTFMEIAPTKLEKLPPAPPLSVILNQAPPPSGEAVKALRRCSTTSTTAASATAAAATATTTTTINPQ